MTSEVKHRLAPCLTEVVRPTGVHFANQLDVGAHVEVYTEDGEAQVKLWKLRMGMRRARRAFLEHYTRYRHVMHQVQQPLLATH